MKTQSCLLVSDNMANVIWRFQPSLTGARTSGGGSGVVGQIVGSSSRKFKTK